MPIYDFTCKCGNSLINELVNSHNTTMFCNKCNGIMQKKISLFANHTYPKEGITLKHVAKEPVTFHSRREMKAYATKHNLILGALE